MPDVEDWRRRRAEELFNGAPIPRSPLETQAALAAAGGPRTRVHAPATAADPVPRPRLQPTIVASAAGSAVAVPRPRPVQPAPAAARGAPHATPYGSSFGTTGLAVVAVLLAGASGWIARGLTSPATPAVRTTQAAPDAAPVAVVPVAVLPSASPPAEPARIDASAASMTAEATLPTVASPARVPREQTSALPALAAHATTVKRFARLGASVDSSARRDDLGSPTSGPDASARVARQARGVAPSFSCRRNRGTVTAMICADPDLARMDRELTTRFRTLDRTAPPDEVERLHEGETTFLNARQSCRTPDCIADVYSRRLDEIGTSH